MGTTVSTVPPIDRRTDRGSTLSHIAQGRPAGRCWREMARCEGPAPLGGSTLPPHAHEVGRRAAEIAERG
ncbi:unnamed protein product, partial [Nesidiocoris tenuis]